MVRVGGATVVAGMGSKQSRSSTGAGDAGRRRRAAAQAVFEDLAQDYVSRPGVDRAAMFGSNGLRAGGSFFAFVGSDARLVLKLPEEQASMLRDAGTAGPVRVGRGTARGWVGVPAPGDSTTPPTETWDDSIVRRGLRSCRPDRV